jgi:hypothetical protein
VPKYAARPLPRRRHRAQRPCGSDAATDWDDAATEWDAATDWDVAATDWDDAATNGEL